MSTQTRTAVITWRELFTNDVETASRFYADLFGGDTTAMGDYTMLRVNGHEHAGFVKNEHPEIPSHWYPYVSVEDTDATIARAKELGAEVRHGPETIEGMLRFAALGDPQGATFGVLTAFEEPEEERPASIVAWNELLAADVDGAVAFYGGLFGWTIEPFGSQEYLLLKAGEETVGGLMKKPDDSPAPAWMTYFSTPDVDATAKKAEELGATVMMQPTSMGNVGRFAVLADPTGAAFGIHAGD